MESQGGYGRAECNNTANKKQSQLLIPLNALPNRRVPNGTHGGVRGRGLITPSYSIRKGVTHDDQEILSEGNGFSMRLL